MIFTVLVSYGLGAIPSVDEIRIPAAAVGAGVWPTVSPAIVGAGVEPAVSRGKAKFAVKGVSVGNIAVTGVSTRLRPL